MTNDLTEDTYRTQLTDRIHSRFAEKEPSDEEKERLRQSHLHHLVRDTTSVLSLDRESDIQGVEIDAEVEIPDMYCFTCGEWVGLSGVDLRGTPRSKEDAYYLGGPPEDIEKAQDVVREELLRLAEYVVENVESIETVEDGLQFVADQQEQLSVDSHGDSE